MWNVVKEISNTENKEIHIKQIRTENDNIIHGDIAISNSFNIFFYNVEKNLTQKIGKPPAPTLRRKSVSQSIFLEPAEETDIISVINTLKLNKAPGINMIRAETIQQIAVEIASPLAHLINKIIETDICPPEFTTAIIKPLYKNGDKLQVFDYRPISLISNFTKIFEKIIKSIMMKYIYNNKLLSDRQFGFMEGKSIEDAISSLSAEIYRALDDNKASLRVFLDLAKAFFLWQVYYPYA